MPLPEPTVPPPHIQVPSQSLQAAGSPGPGTGFVPPETGPCCCPCSRSCSRPGADPPELLCSCLCLRLQSPFGKQLPHQLHQLSRAPSWPSCAAVATPQTKPAISNNQRKVSSCCCLEALRPLLSSILPSSVGVLHLTPWTRGEDMRGRVSQEEGRSGDAGGAQLGTERVSSLETPSCPGSAQAFRGNRSAPAAITNPTGNGA